MGEFFALKPFARVVLAKIVIVPCSDDGNLVPKRFVVRIIVLKFEFASDHLLVWAIYIDAIAAPDPKIRLSFFYVRPNRLWQILAIAGAERDCV